jgi:predicted DNA-binding protein (UPF0251 family)
MCRRVCSRPETTYFKPAGVRVVDLEESTLSVDEYEAVRLKDLEGLEQEECARRMNISQPTFHRMIVAARKKIADAIINGKAIRIEGGNVSISEGASGKIGISRRRTGNEDCNSPR